jgi:hypothetical protein
MNLPRRVVLPSVVLLVAAVALGLVLLSGGSREPAVSAVTTEPEASEEAPAAGTEARRQLDQFTVAVRDFNYAEPGFSATRDKAQSKLWFHDGSWWAPMIDPFTREIHIFELRDGAWADTGVFVDARSESNADVAWTGSQLYIASRTSTGELLLQRYGFGANRAWEPQLPQAQVIAEGGGQSLTIAVDTRQRVWATWIDGGRVWIASSEPGGTGWSGPVTPPGGEDVQEDDATAITEFSGQIGVLFSNQQRDSFFWTSRSDSQPVEVWQEDLTVSSGVNIADGHINFAVSPTGDIYAAVKTSLGDAGEPTFSALIEVLRRDPQGVWTTSTAATVANQMTRAQLVITADGANLVLIATSPQSGGSLYYKVADAADPRFAPGKGSVLLDWEGAVINDATTVRNVIEPGVPLVVLGSDSATAQYYHAELDIEGVLSRQ